MSAYPTGLVLVCLLAVALVIVALLWPARPR